MTKTKIVIIDKDIESIVPGFLENRENDIAILEENIQQENFNGIESIGHKMAGNAGGYGFHELGTIGRKIESAAQANDAESIKMLIDDIREYLSAIEVKYE